MERKMCKRTQLQQRREKAFLWRFPCHSLPNLLGQEYENLEAISLRIRYYKCVHTICNDGNASIVYVWPVGDD